MTSQQQNSILTELGEIACGCDGGGPALSIIKQWFFILCATLITKFNKEQ